MPSAPFASESTLSVSSLPNSGEDPDNSKGEECKTYIEERLAYLTAQEEKQGSKPMGRNQQGQGSFGRGGGGYNSGGDFLGKRDGGARRY